MLKSRIPSHRHWALVVCLLAPLGAPQAASSSGISFQHKDWELACDNTRTCRAAGYSSDSDDMPISVLLTRKAGAAAEVTGEVQTGSFDDERSPKQLRLQGVGKTDEVIVVPNNGFVGVLSPAQVQFLLKSARAGSTLVFAEGKRRWTLSLDGAQAVLLKMDEAQGRLNTPTALVRKGQQPASGVLAPLPPPVIRVPKLPAALPQDKQLLPAIIPSLKAALGADSHCPLLVDTTIKDKQEVMQLEARLSSTQLLVSHLCWRAAYNAGYGYWVVQDRPPHKAVLVMDEGTGVGGAYSNGEISYSQKGRGVGDCWSSGASVWNGKEFVTSEEKTTGMCRAIANGGAWELPTYTSTVIHEK
ncbi:MAG: DUF1176 domain-containing protein [Pseudomonadota bacterium]|nr:DUF1176 domain-containing protein [Pseudomonadota bacterium]